MFAVIKSRTLKILILRLFKPQTRTLSFFLFQSIEITSAPQSIDDTEVDRMECSDWSTADSTSSFRDHTRTVLSLDAVASSWPS